MRRWRNTVKIYSARNAIGATLSHLLRRQRDLGRAPSSTHCADSLLVTFPAFAQHRG